MNGHQSARVVRIVLTANMSFRMIGSNRPTAELRDVREDGRVFHVLVLIAKRNSVRAI